MTKTWEAQDKAARKRSYTRLLRNIVEVDQSPCEARTAAKGELKTYLTKILPKACGAK